MAEGKGLTKGLLDGLSDKGNKFPDASTKLPKSPSVDSDATRKKVAKSHSLTEGRKA